MRKIGLRRTAAKTGLLKKPVLAWTLRKAKVRVISARPASKQERNLYEEKKIKHDQERNQYLNHDFGEILAKAKPLSLDIEFPAPTQAISIRLPRDVLNRIRILADEQDIPYQSLIKLWLVEKLRQAA